MRYIRCVDAVCHVPQVGGHDAADILGEALDEMEPVEHNHDTFDPEIEGHEEHGEAQVVMLFLFSALLVGCASRFMLEVAPSAHLSAPVCSRSYGGAIAMTFPLTRRCAQWLRKKFKIRIPYSVVLLIIGGSIHPATIVRTRFEMSGADESMQPGLCGYATWDKVQSSAHDESDEAFTRSAPVIRIS